MKATKQPCIFGGIYGAYAEAVIQQVARRYRIALVYREDLPAEAFGSLHSATDIRIGINRYAQIRAFIEGYKAGICS